MRFSRQLAVIIALLVFQLLPTFADDVITNVMSPVVSYQYYDSVGDNTNATVITPIVSYQYFDSPVAGSVNYLNSPLVSYLYQFVTSLVPVALHGHVTDTNGVPLSDVAVSLFVGALQTTLTNTDANGFYQFPVATNGGSYSLLASKTAYQGQMLGLTLNANTAEQNFQLLPLATSWAVF